MAFGPVDNDLDLVALEERVLARWQSDDVIGAVPDTDDTPPPPPPVPGM